MSPTHLEILENLPKLPDDMIVSDQLAAILLNCSTRTLRRGSSVPRIKTGDRTGGRRLGDIRKLTRGESAPTAA
jgi:hypothetical protein